MILAKILLWLALGWVLHANVGYLALLQAVALFRRRLVKQADITPSMSLLIAARNEEAVIATKLENTLALDYPPDRLEVFVVSDASTDRTDEIVGAFAGRGVLLNRVPDGQGKVNALNATVPVTTGDVLVFSDADSNYAPDALRKLARNLADPSVGAVTGEERRVAAASGEGLGEGLYARLDNRIKRLEGQVGSMVMVNGGFFAIRRELYPFLEPHLIHDSIVPCLLRLQGYRTAYEPDATSVETYPLDAAGDFRRRVRTVLQAFYSYLAVPAALNPFRTGWYAFALFSHRFTRWFVVPWLAVALAANLALAGEGPLYLGLLAAQLLCYGLASTGWLLDRAGKRVRLFYFPYYFVYIHLAAFVAVVQAMLGKRVATWKPTDRVVPGRQLP
jgi:biofilm PGA synthesis N-glycosyltransferase PgaC